MPAAFGFSPYPQQPAPSAMQVGQMLMARQPAPAPLDLSGGPTGPNPSDFEPAGHQPSALANAIAEAQTRGQPWQHQQSPVSPASGGFDYSGWQMQSMGLSPLEISLLRRTGGAQ